MHEQEQPIKPEGLIQLTRKPEMERNTRGEGEEEGEEGWSGIEENSSAGVQVGRDKGEREEERREREKERGGKRGEKKRRGIRGRKEGKEKE